MTIIAIAVASGLAAYFIMSLYYFPNYFVALPEAQPVVSITNVTISETEIILGQSFIVQVGGENMGDSADIQIVSVAFPNATETTGIVEIRQHNFTQTPFINAIGSEIGANYTGGTISAIATYPSVEFYSRPWHSGSSYSAEIEVTPDRSGEFVIFVKTIALPHSSDQAHFPREGILDYQNEFVAAYRVLVT